MAPRHVRTLPVLADFVFAAGLSQSTELDQEVVDVGGDDSGDKVSPGGPSTTPTKWTDLFEAADSQARETLVTDVEAPK